MLYNKMKGKMNTTNQKRKSRTLKIALLLSSSFLALAIIFFLYSQFWTKSSQGPNQTSGTKDPAEIAKIAVDPRFFEFGLYIQKISLAVPVVEDVDGTNKTTYNKALLSGVAHYKGTALPGQSSNIFIFGHSSTWNGEGQYAEAFSKLNDLDKNDKVIIYYQNKEFIYSVWKKEVIAADDFTYLNPTKSEQVTLMTCWPIGSNLKRLVVVAKLEQ